MVTTLAELCSPWPELVISGPADVRVDRVVADSREAGPGAVFVAVRGTGADGHRFVPQAVAAGCAAVVVAADQAPAVRAALPDPLPAAWVVASSTRGLPARLARECEGRPDRDLVCAGVTGTNGKTTTTYLLRELLAELHGRCGLLGTICYADGAQEVAAPLTTPGGPELYRWLARMRDTGCGAAAMEISSHALDQQRPGDLALDAAVLTNLGRDHLDYHGDMASYLAAKARILDLLRDRPGRGKPAGVAVINGADPSFARLDPGDLRTVRFVADPDAAPPARRAADLQVTGAVLGLEGTVLQLRWRGEELELRSPLVGRFNVENLTAALACGLGLGYAPGACVAALGAVAQVPGRLERFALPGGGLAVVDYAHTHDALAAVLGACRELQPRRLSVVFGCGGDRDRGKRPLMAEVAATGADLVWITSDNPRSEDPGAICEDIVTAYDGLTSRRARRREVVVDRREAITAALAAAGERDVVVIAGKGHEDYQVIGDEVRHLDDRQIVRDWIAGATR
jgi:UDP-N-acetylmuramoyl-L-alanyl-D-glutamate--2,6-diaminopimelate ligase